MTLRKAASFKVDENLPQELTEQLRQAGFDAMSVLDQRLGGAIDEVLAAKCAAELRTIVTFDLEFGDVRKYPPGDHAGIIVLRLTQQDVGHVLAVFAKVIDVLAARSPNGQLWIVDERGIRVRGASA